VLLVPFCAVDLTGSEFTEMVDNVVRSWLPGREYVKVQQQCVDSELTYTLRTHTHTHLCTMRVQTDTLFLPNTQLEHSSL
jgi:hypothetical protein